MVAIFKHAQTLFRFLKEGLILPLFLSKHGHQNTYLGTLEGNQPAN